MKFEVGSKVRFVKTTLPQDDSTLAYFAVVGQVGEVIEANKDAPFPYAVRFPNAEEPLLFWEKEIEPA